jgi:3-oxoacyl-[acyl-carrier protein] reductase
MKLNGRVAVVTGGGRGIGRSISLRFALEGAHVLVADILEGEAAAVADEITGAGGNARAFVVDVTDARRIQQMVEAAVESWGRIDVLVTCAGVGLTKLMLDTTLDEWQRVLRINLTGVFLCCQTVARVMVRQGSGRIINIASLSGQRGGTGRSAYGASKAGVTALTKVMAVELAPHGICVNEIAPGPVNTEMTAVTHDEATRQAYHNLIPMRRYAERDEIAAAAVFLASDEAEFVNGHTLNVDGGFAAAGLMFELPPAKR